MKSRLSIKSNSFLRQRLLVSAFLIIVCLCMSIGYAMYYTELNVGATAYLNRLENLKITAVNANSFNNAVSSDISYTRVDTATGTNLTVSSVARFNGDNPFIIYTINISNKSQTAYTYNGLTNTATINGINDLKKPRLLGLQVGDVIPAKSSKEVTLIYFYEGIVNNQVLETNTILNFLSGQRQLTKPSVNIALEQTEFELDKTNLDHTRFDAINLYDVSQKFTLSLSNDQIEILDESGNPKNMNFLLNSNESVTDTYYLHVKDGNDGYVVMSADLIIEYEDGRKEVAVENILMYEFEDRPTVKPSKAEVQYTVEPAANGSWLNHFIGYFTLINNSDLPINQWTMYIQLEDEMNILSIQNWNDEWTYDPNTKILKISSDYRYENRHRVIQPHSSYTTYQMIIEMTNPDFYVKSITIFQDGEVNIFDDHYTAGNGKK